MKNLFISYSHLDESTVKEFIKHLAPLKSNGIVEEWFDRKIMSGDDFQEKIDKELESADIICLMISHNFLSSKACIKEKDDSLKLRTSRGIRVIPVILSACAWTEHKEISDLLATPTDGKPITSFIDINEGILNAISWIKTVCLSIDKIKNLKIKEEFKTFLESADILTKSHNNKETLFLNDIFVYPKLKKINGVEAVKKYDSKNLTHDVLELKKIIIAGENQSGKTTLCKILYKIFIDLNYIPVYIEDDNNFLGNPISKIENAFQEQYENEKYVDIDKSRIVPIIDNFHFAKHQEKYIEVYKIFKCQVLVVDDIYGLNIQKQNLIKDYNKFKINEFNAVERDLLIRKWILITENDLIKINQNHLQQSIDEKTEMIENSLGVIFGKGIMPSFPFFILSLLAAQDIQKPLDQEITSQGHCYQALIYLYLRKEGVRNDQFDIYSNFLTELAFFIYKNGGNSLDNSKFNEFLEIYTSRFNMPIPIADVISKLNNVSICRFDSLNQFSFCYSYIYYFFVAKYISENIEENKVILNKIICNLHTDENAYITVFITHHSKSNYLLDELLLNAEIQFEKYKPSTLDHEELSFFDKNEEKIIKAILPAFDHNCAEERSKLLEIKSNIEERKNGKDVIQQDNSSTEDESEEASELLHDLRLSIKTVEVMGLIIKNRSGSLGLDKLEYIFEQGLKVHLRILTSFFELIKDERTELEFIEFINERICQINEDRKENNEKELSIEKIEKISKEIFWNMSFGVVHGFITKAIHSLGSSNLLKIAENVSNKENTPSSFIVYQGITMWYGKSIKLNEISSRISKDDFSKTADKLIKFKVVEHSRLHKIEYGKLQEIGDKLNMSIDKLLADRALNK